MLSREAGAGKYQMTISDSSDKAPLIRSGIESGIFADLYDLQTEAIDLSDNYETKLSFNFAPEGHTLYIRAGNRLARFICYTDSKAWQNGHWKIFWYLIGEY